jgi:dTDP-4-amino-4,6-dideoxygalactose transaminase
VNEPVNAPTAPAILPLFDLARQWPALRDEVLRTVDRLAAGGAFSLGQELRDFEDEFASFCGTEACVGTANGTSAIEIALRSLGVGPGDEVITVPHTFIATLEAIAATGATPRLVDVDPDSRCLDPGRVEAALTSRTRAVVVVHLYGRPAPMTEICSIADAAGVHVVEDCAQAHGALYEGRRVGSWGAAGAFSFYPTKNLGAFGDGGAVTTSRDDVAAAARSLRHHGSSPDDANVHVRADGGTERLDNLQAAILRLRLRRLDEENDQRREAAARYRDLLAGLPVKLPPEDSEAMRSVYHLFAVEVDDRDAVRAALNSAGVMAGVHYPTPAHLQPGWAHLGYGRGDFPASERLAQRVLTLPLFPGIRADEQDRVATELAAALP